MTDWNNDKYIEQRAALASRLFPGIQLKHDDKTTVQEIVDREGTKMVIPFSNGTCAHDWDSENCGDCIYATIDECWEDIVCPCPIQMALSRGAITGDCRLDVMKLAGYGERYQDESPESDFNLPFCCPLKQTDPDKAPKFVDPNQAELPL